MAVKASATITLTSYRDTQSVTRYYKLQPAGSSAPLKPDTKPPSSDWTDSEPACDISKELYFCDLTIFSNGEGEYSKVSKSTSYEAAKQAYNKAQSAKDSIDNLEIGGRNLYQNSKGPFTLIPRNTGTATDNFNYCEVYVGMTLNETYTISVDVEITDGTFNKITVYPYPNGLAQNVNIPENGRISYTFTKTSETTDRVLLYAGIFGETRGNGVIFRNLKIEKGNKATDWTPAPEDVDAGIANAAKVATNFLGYDSTNGLIIGNKTSGTWSGYRSQILPGSFNVLDASSTVLASFGLTTVIGEEAKANMHLTFNNLSMVDKDGTKFFEVGDSRNADGIATIKHIERTHVYDNGEAVVAVNSDISSIVSVYADSVQLSSSKYSFSGDTVMINGLTANSEKTIEITYTTTESTVYLTFGERNLSGNIGNYSIAEGRDVISSGYCSHAEGSSTTASHYSSHAEGLDTESSGWASHAEGRDTTASGDYSHAEGGYTTASHYCSHAEGDSTTASGVSSHAEGHITKASGNYSHAEGDSTTASGSCSHAEGTATTASGDYSHAEGGNSTTASGNYSHAEGGNTTASGSCSHAEGGGTTASYDYSHAEGYFTTASKWASHAEGYNTTASGDHSHAEGSETTASGSCSHAGGLRTVADGNSMTAIGEYNTKNSGKAFVIGNGTSDEARSDAFTVDWDGNTTIKGRLVCHGMAGEIKMWAGNNIPSGWLLCDGSEVSKTKYPNLYAAIGDLWGVPNSSSNFKLPNLKGKVPVGYDSSDTDFSTVGKTDGEKTHKLTPDEIPAHGHGMAHTHSYTGPNTGTWKVGTNGKSHKWCTSAGGKTSGGASKTTTDNAGGSLSHNNLQPYAVIKYIICAF